MPYNPHSTRTIQHIARRTTARKYGITPSINDILGNDGTRRQDNSRTVAIIGLVLVLAVLCFLVLWGIANLDITALSAAVLPYARKELDAAREEHDKDNALALILLLVLALVVSPFAFFAVLP